MQPGEAKGNISAFFLLQGGLSGKRLSRMSVRDICVLLENLNGVSQSRLGQYLVRIQENNISGVVLLNCDLTDLKAVMQMAFGDWEIFRALVQALRDQEMSFDVSKNDSTEGMNESPQQVNFTQSAPSSDPDVETPHAHYPPQVERSWTSVDHGRVPYGENIQGQRRAGGAADRMGRQDSIVEMLMESQALRGMVEAVGASSSSEDESPDGVVNMAPITEEKHSPVGSCDMQQHKYSEDEPDSDAEEMEMMTRKARQSRGSQGLPKIKLTKANTAASTSLDLPSDSSAAASPCQAPQKTTFPPVHDESLEALEQVPLIGQKDARKKPGHERKRGESKSLMLNLQIEDQFPPVRTDGGTGDIPLSSVSDLNDVPSPGFTPSSSHEHLALRKLAQGEDVNIPSAFQLVSPVSSRASSRASLGSIRIVPSREGSVDGARAAGVEFSPERKSANAMQPCPLLEDSSDSSMAMVEDASIITVVDGKEYSDGKSTCKM